MNRQRIYNIVEYIGSCGDFPYDMDDVIETLYDILGGYEIYAILTNDEYCLLVDELLEFAYRSEIREAVRWAEWQLECGQDSGTDYRIPNT